MSDQYHWGRNPADLIEARLTKDEAEALASYRDARNRDTDRVRNLVIVLPISEEMLTASDFDENVEKAITDMASKAALDAIRSQLKEGPS